MACRIYTNLVLDHQVTAINEYMTLTVLYRLHLNMIARSNGPKGGITIYN